MYLSGVRTVLCDLRSTCSLGCRTSSTSVCEFSFVSTCIEADELGTRISSTTICEFGSSICSLVEESSGGFL
jgi:hypothetical protein